MKQLSYQYKNIPIPGGGYVTGFVFHKKEKGLLYARTDIGGTYRFDFRKQKWKSLMSHVTLEDLSETYPISIALDPNRPQMLYIACGINQEKSGVLAISKDFGENFCYEKIPVFIHGNLGGRGTDERLLVDQNDSNILYFASQQEGLWSSKDAGKNWEKIKALPEEYLTFICQAGKALIVGTAGVSTREHDFLRGHSLYLSYDGGEHFWQMPEPASHVIEGCKLNGLVAQRFCLDKDSLYVTFASTGRRSYILENGYSCDSGDTIDGHVVRYKIEKDGTIQTFHEITPYLEEKEHEILDYGFSGICASMQTPGMLVTSTIVKDDGDCIYRSYDYGKTWETILFDLEIGKMEFRAPYMKPEYNGGHSLIHWMSDLKLNPFCEGELWFNSGTGVFLTRDCKADQVIFSDWCDGIEETVHLNVYAPPAGKKKVIDIVGDLGGFAFDDLEHPCENSFADEHGNRYITCINADYSDEHPECLIVTPRGNWTGKTKGGLIRSNDQGVTFRRIPMPFGLSDEIDEALHFMEHPNVNSGWVALSPDCNKIVWSIADMISLPVSRMITSQDGGKSFEMCQIFDKKGDKKTTGCVKVYADRLNSSLFYGFGDHFDFYISKDGGKSFREYVCFVETFRGEKYDFEKRHRSKCEQLNQEAGHLSTVDFGMIDCANRTEIRGESGKSGVFYMALNTHGLWKLRYDLLTDQLMARQLSKPKDAVFRVGLGLGTPEGDYMKSKKAIYCNANIDGQYGFYRTLDDGKTFERINTEKQMYGDINSIDGDKRVFGRYYIATGSVGLLCGEPID